MHDQQPMFKSLNLPHHLFLYCVLLLLWMLLTGSVAGDALMAGVIVAAMASLISAPYLHIFEGVR